MKKITLNTITNELTEESLTAEEIKKLEEINAESEARRLAEAEAEAAKQAKLESARTKLAALGLDEDEIAAIVGI